MEVLLSELETYMYDIVEVCTSLLEFFGIVVLVTSAVRAFIRWIRRDRQNIRLDLAQGIALALEFKMGGRFSPTVVVREWSELGTGALIVLRAMLTFLDSLGDQEREEGHGRKVCPLRLQREDSETGASPPEQYENNTGAWGCWSHWLRPS